VRGGLVKVKRKNDTKSLESAVEDYLRDHPDLEEALEIFNISQKTYVGILSATSPPVRTTNSTNSR